MKHRPLALALVASALMSAAFFRHQLRHDDFVFCFESVHLTFWKFLWTPYGGHILPLHRLLYAALRPLFGLSPLPYFAVVFVTHLACVYLLYRIILRLTEREAWAAFWAGLWGAALPSVGTLILLPTYGQALAELFALLVLNDLVAHRARGVMPSTPRVGLWVFALALAALSVGTGTAAGLGIYICAALLLRGDGARRVAALVGATAIAIVLSYMSLQRHLGDPTRFDPALSGFALKAFGLLGAQGIANLFFPALFSVTTGDDAVGPLKNQSASVVMVVTVLAALTVAVPAYRAARALSLERRRAWLALTAMSALNYALIALGRSGTVSVFGGSPQSLAQAIRYHYYNLAFVSASFAVAFSESQELRTLLQRRWVRYGISAWAVVAFVTSYGVLRHFSMADSDQAAWARKELVERVETRVREAPPERIVYVPNTQYAPTYFLFAVGVPPTRFPHSAAAWMCENRSDVVDGHEIRFVEKDPEVVRALRQRPESPAARIVVTSNEAGEVLPQRFALNDPHARDFVLRGIYEDTNDQGYAWTALVFAVRLGTTPAVTERGGVLAVNVYVPDIVIQQNHSVVLTARIGETRLSPRTIDASGIQDLEFEVPKGVVPTGEADIEFGLDKRVVDPRDDRELGILAHRFELRAR